MTSQQPKLPLDDIEVTGQTGSLDLGGPLPPEVLQREEQLRATAAKARTLMDMCPACNRPMDEVPHVGHETGYVLDVELPTELPPPDPPPNPPASAMSLLDLFAANALSGMLASGVNGLYSNKDDLIHASNQAYVIARAMLAAREVFWNDTLMSAIQRGRR